MTPDPLPATGAAPTVVKELSDQLRESLRSGYLFGCYDEPLDLASRRVVRVILDRLERADDSSI